MVVVWAIGQQDRQAMIKRRDLKIASNRRRVCIRLDSASSDRLQHFGRCDCRLVSDLRTAWRRRGCACIRTASETLAAPWIPSLMARCLQPESVAPRRFLGVNWAQLHAVPAVTDSCD